MPFKKYEILTSRNNILNEFVSIEYTLLLYKRLIMRNAWYKFQNFATSNSTSFNLTLRALKASKKTPM